MLKLHWSIKQSVRSELWFPIKSASVQSTTKQRLEQQSNIYVRIFKFHFKKNI